MDFFTGCTFAPNDEPGRILPGVPCEQTLDHTEADMSTKFYVQESPCIEYEGQMSMTCPAGNNLVDRAPVWETAAPWEQWYNLQQALPQVVCQVCDVLLGEDIDDAENSVTFELSFGPNMIHGEINQIDVLGYEVYWVDADDIIVDVTPAGIVAKPSGATENVISDCGCDASKYTVPFVNAPVPPGAEGLLVVPTDNNGFTMPAGRVARFADTHTTSTTTDTSTTKTTGSYSATSASASSVTSSLVTGVAVETDTITTTALVLPPTINSKAQGFAQLSVTVLAFLVAAATTSA